MDKISLSHFLKLDVRQFSLKFCKVSESKIFSKLLNTSKSRNSLLRTKQPLAWIVPTWMSDHRGFWPREFNFPAQPRLGEVHVGSWLKAQQTKGSTTVFIPIASRYKKGT